VVNAYQDSLHRELALGQWSEVAGFGETGQADWQVRGEPSDFEVLHQGTVQGRVQWGLGGVHNQMNALAAIIAAQHVGVAVAQACQALSTFENVRRRMEVRGTVGTGTQAITVYDDFAHHPTAIRTTVDGLRRQVGAARILAVFEPRSNTMKLGAMKSQLPWSLEQTDLAFCHTAGLDWDAAEALASMGTRAQTADNIDALVAQVKAAAQPGDHVLCMSNGGFGGVHAKLLQALKA
jgi:UDP-N-acetylmuramate: L-alanyl-gamma-D-glutamyl-meso-diaminopimelate ligase